MASIQYPASIPATSRPVSSIQYSAVGANYWENHDPPFTLAWASEWFTGIGYDLFYVSETALISLGGKLYSPEFDIKGWRNCCAIAAEAPGRDDFVKAYGVADLAVPDFLLQRQG